MTCSSMFENCRKLKSLDLSHFVTSKINDMSNMFNNCTELEILKVDSFDTQKVRDMKYMFGSCTNLKSLNIANFDTSSCTNFENMFENDDGLNLYIDSRRCSNLVDLIPKSINITDVSKNN